VTTATPDGVADAALQLFLRHGELDLQQRADDIPVGRGVVTSEVDPVEFRIGADPSRRAQGRQRQLGQVPGVDRLRGRHEVGAQGLHRLVRLERRQGRR